MPLAVMFNGTPDKITAVIAIVVGIVFIMAALARGTMIGGAFTHGRGERLPINRTGRVICLALGAMSIFIGLRALIH